MGETGVDTAERLPHVADRLGLTGRHVDILVWMDACGGHATADQIDIAGPCVTHDDMQPLVSAGYVLMYTPVIMRTVVPATVKALYGITAEGWQWLVEHTDMAIHVQRDTLTRWLTDGSAGWFDESLRTEAQQFAPGNRVQTVSRVVAHSLDAALIWTPSIVAGEVSVIPLLRPDRCVIHVEVDHGIVLAAPAMHHVDYLGDGKSGVDGVVTAVEQVCQIATKVLRDYLNEHTFPLPRTTPAKAVRYRDRNTGS